MSNFKGLHFWGEIVVRAVRRYCRYGISYLDLEQMIAERGVSVGHSTIYRWVQKHAPEIEKLLRWHWCRLRSGSWRVDETYVKVGDKWSYLYRAIDKPGKSMNTAYATIKGFEVMRAPRKGRAAICNLTHDIFDEVLLVGRAFGLGACALAEAVQLVSEQLKAA